MAIPLFCYQRYQLYWRRHHARSDNPQPLEATHRALKVRAAQHGRSTEAEMRDILETAFALTRACGSARRSRKRSRRLGLTNEDIDALSPARDRMPAEPMSFE